MFKLKQFQLLFLTCLLLSVMRSSKPFGKRRQAVWRLECELGVISDAECPVDGGWASWGPWVQCRGPCDGVGQRRRTRLCNNPLPARDGIPCDGPDEETQSCYLTNCTVEDYRKLIEGDITRLDAFHCLQTVPALMERCLQSECTFQAVETALASDNTWKLNSDAIWNALLCVKHNIGCALAGEWGTWGPWSACGARCGEGIRWRLRRCDSPPPSDKRLACYGAPLQAEQCEGDQCALDVRDTQHAAVGSWSVWGPWTPCSEICGLGVKRRRRTCNERTASHVGTWGTHCAGPHDECQVCERKECLLDGGWSGWGAWGPCSQTCSAGRKTRSRSCTRPIPAGGGTLCVGPKTEVVSCYLNPCAVHSHIIALLNGESFLQYNFEKKRSTLFHFFVRFMPLSPHGTLVRRASMHNSYVRLSLHKWHVCLDTSGSSGFCTLPRICSPFILEPAEWHSALVTVSSEAATLRINDAKIPIKGTFVCDPELPDENINIIVGEKLHGGIQELILNFIPLDIGFRRDHTVNTKRCDFCPSSTTNIVYETANIEEAYVSLEYDHFLRLPCFDGHGEWRLELTIKPKREVGTILFLHNGDCWVHVGLQNMRLKLKIALSEYQSETSSTMECPPNQWLHIILLKTRESNAIEVSINSGERLYLVLEEETTRERRESYHRYHLGPSDHSKSFCNISATVGQTNHKPAVPMSVDICKEEFYVGGIPRHVEHSKMSEEYTPFLGIVASISINNVLLDLHDLSMERYNDNDEVQVASKTASVSGSYHETAWGQSNRLNLTCLHARTLRSPHSAHWFLLDTGIKGAFSNKVVRSIDDGRVLRLVASTDEDLRGFYTCRSHSNNRTRNIVTYGVLGKIKYHIYSPDTTTAVAVVTTLALIISTLAWLVIEGIYDLRNGFGFFRDAQLSPEEEAEAVCKYIDKNVHLVGSECAARRAKARARRKGRRLASCASFAAQEPQGINQVDNLMLSESSDMDELPELPEIKSLAIETSHEPQFEPSHEVYRCDPCYISSPRHGSNLTSTQTKQTSSSQASSPRFLHSRLLLAKRIHYSREALNMSTYERNRNSPRKIRSNLLTIKSSSSMDLSPAQKILQKFMKLRSDDDNEQL